MGEEKIPSTEKIIEDIDKTLRMVTYIAKEQFKEAKLPSNGIPCMFLNAFKESLIHEIKYAANEQSLEHAFEILNLNMTAMREIAKQIIDIRDQMGEWKGVKR